MKLILVVMVLALLWLYIFNNQNYEYFENGIINITQNRNQNFEFDEYIFEKDGKEILKTGGKWNLDEKSPFVMYEGKKIMISDKKNVYMFQDGTKYNVSMTYSNMCGNIVINNYADEIKICKKNNGYEVTRSNDILAIIKLEENRKKYNKYTMNIKNNPEYTIIYAIAFIILNQIDKEMSISLDNL